MWPVAAGLASLVATSCAARTAFGIITRSTAKISCRQSGTLKFSVGVLPPASALLAGARGRRRRLRCPFSIWPWRISTPPHGTARGWLGAAAPSRGQIDAGAGTWCARALGSPAQTTQQPRELIGVLQRLGTTAPVGARRGEARARRGPG